MWTKVWSAVTATGGRCRRQRREVARVISVQSGWAQDRRLRAVMRPSPISAVRVGVGHPAFGRRAPRPISARRAPNLGTLRLPGTPSRGVRRRGGAARSSLALPRHWAGRRGRTNRCTSRGVRARTIVSTSSRGENTGGGAGLRLLIETPIGRDADDTGCTGWGGRRGLRRATLDGTSGRDVEGSIRPRLRPRSGPSSALPA